MAGDRLIDVQHDLIIRLEELYQRLTKESKERRTETKLNQYETERTLLINKLSENHVTMLASSPPQEYMTRFEDVGKIDEKFKEKLKSFFEAISINYIPTGGTASGPVHPSGKETLSAEQKTIELEEANKQQQIKMAQLKREIEAQKQQQSAIQLQKESEAQKQQQHAIQLEKEIETHKQQEAKIVELERELEAQKQQQNAIQLEKEIETHKQQEAKIVELERELEAHKQQQKTSINARPDDRLTELLEMLVKSQVEQRKPEQPCKMQIHKFGDIMSDIPTFSGDIAEYKAFKQIFMQAVSLSTWSKMEQYLKLRSKLQGAPKDAISSLYIEESSYDIAWETLDRNYLNPRQMLEHELMRIMSPNFKIIGTDAKSHISSKNTFVNIAANLKQLKLTAIDLLIQLTILQMDCSVRGRLEDFLGGSQTLPTEDKIITFLEKEASIYQNIQLNKNHSEHSVAKQQTFDRNKSKNSNVTTHSHVTTDIEKTSNEAKCLICGLQHTVLDCAVFLASDKRNSLLRFHKICVYCTKHKYRGRPCYLKQKLKCDKCDEKHITEMHPLDDSHEILTSSKKEENVSTNTLLTSGDKASCTILPTAVANIMGPNGLLAPIRCLVDLGSESSYVCAHVAQSLGLRKNKTAIQIKGISGKSQCTTTSYVNLQIKLNDPAREIITTKAYVLPTIADILPSSKIKINCDMKDLADPYFNTPALVGVLLGSDIAAKLFKTDVSCKITKDGWLMQPTHPGWIVCGRGEIDTNRKEISTFVTFHESMLKAINDEEMSKKIKDFNEILEISTNTTDTKSNNELCEALYKNHHYREADGRYVVPTPWKQEAPPLGHSARKAVKLFLRQETIWKKNQEHYLKSNQFMEEYLRMGHMTEIINPKERFNDDGDSHTLAYISILRKDAITTKLRNVFHASLPTSNGISLNDTMYEGEKLQSEIFNVLIKSRSFKYFFSADIEKMFRQIRILPEDRNKMRIVWRSDSSKPLRVFELNAVTYGTNAAPWQAIRTIHQCAYDNSTDDTTIDIIKKAFYVDDLLYGADTVAQCQDLINKIIAVMDKGKFPLTKWLSNDDAVLENIPKDKLMYHYVPDESTPIKILGLMYKRNEDEYLLNVKQPESFKFTKRGFSSIAASVYDPLGFILPVTMRSRLFVQNLWRQKYEWDDMLPENLKTEFISWYKDLKFIGDIRVPRWLGTNADYKIELIGFSDASGVARAAVIYSRVEKDGKYLINFLAAKGNVNKLNSTLIIQSQQNTIPKNELDAIVILVELLVKVRDALDGYDVTFRVYTDSKVALSWIRSSATNENKYIRKRVEKIKSYLDPNAIHFVKSSENPADPASRGLSAESLKKCALWFEGPSWLKEVSLPETPSLSEINCTRTLLTVNLTDIFENISKFATLMRIIVFMMRWKGYKRKSKSIKVNLAPDYKHLPVTAEEIIQAKVIAIKYYQRLHLNEIYEKLIKNQSLNKRHWLTKLSPFIDNSGSIRVGGRLRNADIPYEQRHPIIIPPGRLVKMLIEYTHKYNLHSGNSITLQKLINEYYIRSIKREVYHVLNTCPICLRWKARVVQPEMSHLPKERVEPGGVFEKIGVDLAGPFQIKASTLRTNKLVKIWIAVFVCLVTKAAHLEIVSSLTTEDFLAALSRMTSRRGPVKEIWSDNGTNFQGASRQLKQTWKIIVDECIDKLSLQEVKWKFIPRHSPTFGGLWEACVKSMKYFVKRMGSTNNFNYEQFYTLICRIESLLNSRPLFPNPVEPNDSLSLTPYHFITSRGFKLLSTDEINEKNSPLTKKWLTILQIQRKFWDKFKTEYLYSLQKRQKWLKQQPNLNVGDVVLLKEPNASPGNWKMGRVSKVFPDTQGVIRTVSVQDSLQKETRQAVNQLVPLSQKEEFSEPVEIRRSLRNKNISATQVLITWLALVSSANALNYTIFSPGVHVINMKKVFVKAMDLNVVIEMNLNVTNDISIIKNSVTDLSEFCATLDEDSKVKSYCLNAAELLEIHTEQAISEIMNVYGIDKRKKRWISWTLKGAKVAAKYATPVLLATGLVYQEYEIHKLEKQNDIIKERIRKASMILLNITELEHDEIDNKLSSTIKNQQEANIISDINSFCTISTLLIDTIKERHATLKNAKPYKELHIQFEDVRKKIPYVIIPPIEDIFSIAEKEINIINSEKIEIKFKIPLVHQETVNHYGIINIPDTKGFIIDFNTKNYYFEVVANFNNLSYFIPTPESKLIQNIYFTTNWEQTKHCFSILFHVKEANSTCKRTYFPMKNNTVISIDYNVALTLTPTENVTVMCNDGQFTFEASAAIVNFSQCILKVGYDVKNNMNIKFNNSVQTLPKVNIPTPKIQSSIFRPNHTELNKLETELKELINTDEVSLPTESNWYTHCLYGGVITTIIGIAIIIIVGILCRKKRRQLSLTDEQPNWESPMAEDKHRVPESRIIIQMTSK